MQFLRGRSGISGRFFLHLHHKLLNLTIHTNSRPRSWSSRLQPNGLRSFPFRKPSCRHPLSVGTGHVWRGCHYSHSTCPGELRIRWTSIEVPVRRSESLRPLLDPFLWNGVLLDKLNVCLSCREEVCTRGDGSDIGRLDEQEATIVIGLPCGSWLVLQPMAPECLTY